MKALTVQQPFAWAIVHGGKLIENRTQNWSYRGPLAIHAGQRWSGRGAHSLLVARAYLDALASEGWRPLEPDGAAERYAEKGLPPGVLSDVRGSIIGLVDLVDVHPEAGGCCSPWGESSYVEHGGRTRRVIYHLVLEQPSALARPVPCRGYQGLWTPAAEVLDEITRQDVGA